VSGGASRHGYLKVPSLVPDMKNLTPQTLALFTQLFPEFTSAPSQA
jgi:hypothetical protein